MRFAGRPASPANRGGCTVEQRGVQVCGRDGRSPRARSHFSDRGRRKKLASQTVRVESSLTWMPQPVTSVRSRAARTVRQLLAPAGVFLGETCGALLFEVYLVLGEDRHCCTYLEQRVLDGGEPGGHGVCLRRAEGVVH